MNFSLLLLAEVLIFRILSSQNFVPLHYFLFLVQRGQQKNEITGYMKRIAIQAQSLVLGQLRCNFFFFFEEINTIMHCYIAQVLESIL